MSELFKEFHGRGLINRFFLAHGGWLFSLLAAALVTWIWNHESALAVYVEAHDEAHVELNGKLDSKLDGLMEQMNVNFTANEIARRIDKEEVRRMTVSERLSAVNRVIERGDANLPEIYFADRDRYVTELLTIDREIANLKEQM